MEATHGFPNVPVPRGSFFQSIHLVLSEVTHTRQQPKGGGELGKDDPCYSLDQAMASVLEETMNFILQARLLHIFVKCSSRDKKKYLHLLLCKL